MVKYICDKCGETIYKSMMATLTLERRDGQEIVVEEMHYCPECTEELLNWADEED